MKIALSTVAVVVALALAAVIGGRVVGAARLPAARRDAAPARPERPGHRATGTSTASRSCTPRTATDLFRAQGYVHAQDRFWEMDFRRHVTGGPAGRAVRRRARWPPTRTCARMGWRRVAEQEWQLIGAEAQRATCRRTPSGVNAWLAEHGGAAAGAKSLEYAVLGLQNPALRDRAVEPGRLAGLAQGDGVGPARQHGRPRSPGRLLLAHGLSRRAGRRSSTRRTRTTATGRSSPTGAVGTAPSTPTAPAPATRRRRRRPPGRCRWRALDRLADGLARLPGLIGDGGAGIGSNSWVVSGAHTATGKPMLANDPHLSPSMPGIWYQMGLHCDVRLQRRRLHASPACPAS